MTLKDKRNFDKKVAKALSLIKDITNKVERI